MAFNIFQKKKDTKSTSFAKGKGDSSVTQFKETASVSKESKKEAKVMDSGSATQYHRIVIRPRITEKATNVTADGVYVFDIADFANKTQVRDAIKEIYKITPKKVNISYIKEKKVRNRKTGARGVKSGGKKAYVYLNKGDSIQFV